MKAAVSAAARRCACFHFIYEECEAVHFLLEVKCRDFVGVNMRLWLSSSKQGLVQEVYTVHQAGQRQKAGVIGHDSLGTSRTLYIER